MSMQTFAPFIERRQALARRIEHPVVVLAGLEQPQYRFSQESSFYYLTGLHESGLALWLEPDGTSILFVPEYGQSRAQWVGGAHALAPENADQYGFNEIRPLGKASASYYLTLASDPAAWIDLIEWLKQKTALDIIGTAGSRDVLCMLANYVPAMSSAMRDFMATAQPSCQGAFVGGTVDVTPIIARMRRIKSREEIAALSQACDITLAAHDSAVRVLGAFHDSDVTEAALSGIINHTFIEMGAVEAFPSIVASGRHGTVLHHTASTDVVQHGDCLIVDIGACFDHYCADVTRTYPVAGEFTKRQAEIYKAVLETHEYIAEIAQPGYWIRNDEVPEKSLHHCAKKFLAERKLDAYFTHGIGHFLGLDVHDAGDVREPLQENDVITIEPGIYIPEENLGIRIEDDYWVVKNGAVCLTDGLPREMHLIEEFMAECRHGAHECNGECGDESCGSDDENCDDGCCGGHCN